MRGRLWLALALAAAGLAGCANSGVPQLPPVPTTVAASSATSAPDSGGAFLQSVSGRSTTTSVALGPGTSGLRGVVQGPNGPVSGAVVQVQRQTAPGISPATDRILTAADGSWSLSGILGGAYVLRSWLAPGLAMTQAVTIFLAKGEQRQVQMTVQQYNGMVVSSSMAPNPPLVGQPANLVVLVTNTTVDGNGIVRSVPVAGALVELAGSDAWQVSTENPTTTGSNGEAGWELTCEATGSQPLSVTVNSASTDTLAQIGNCQIPPTTTTTTAPSSTTPSSTTPTTTTTSTTRKGKG